MASSGSFSTNSCRDRNLIFSWAVAKTDEDNNQTTIDWKLTGGDTADGYKLTQNIKVVIDGVTVFTHTMSKNGQIKLYNGTVVKTGTYTFTHDNEGNREFTAYVEAGIYEWDPNCYGSATYALPQIPRASTITSAQSVVLGHPCNITWTPMSTAFRYRLEFRIGDWVDATGAIHPNTTSPYTYTGYTLPIEVASEITDDYYSDMSVTLFTYSDAGATESIGDGNSTTFMVVVPDSVAPTLDMTLTPVHSLPEAFNGLYVQGLSKVKADFVATAPYGAEIVSYDMTVDGSAYGIYSKYTSNYLTTVGDLLVTGHVKDSRTHSAYAEDVITVLPYANPKIKDASVNRCDENGNLTDSGTYLQITATRSYHPVVSNGVQKNFCAIQFRYKVASNAYYSSWETILESTDLTSDTITTDALLEGRVRADTSYRVQVRVVDDIGNESVPFETIVPTDIVYWHRDGERNALGLGKYNEKDNALDSGWDIYMNEHKITGLADPVDNTDAVNLGYLKEYIEAYIANLPKG